MFHASLYIIQFTLTQYGIFKVPVCHVQILSLVYSCACNLTTLTTNSLQLRISLKPSYRQTGPHTCDHKEGSSHIMQLN